MYHNTKSNSGNFITIIHKKFGQTFQCPPPQKRIRPVRLWLNGTTGYILLKSFLGFLHPQIFLICSYFYAISHKFCLRFTSFYLRPPQIDFSHKSDILYNYRNRPSAINTRHSSLQLHYISVTHISYWYMNGPVPISNWIYGCYL